MESSVNHPEATLFEQFLKERTFLKNVTPSTLVWYQVAFKNYQASLASGASPRRPLWRRWRPQFQGWRDDSTIDW